jgi:hypothetical protein
MAIMRAQLIEQMVSTDDKKKKQNTELYYAAGYSFVTLGFSAQLTCYAAVTTRLIIDPKHYTSTTDI